MIVISMLLVIVAAVTLGIGVFVADDNLTIIYVSIGAAVLAGIFLLVGVIRSRPSRKPVLDSGAPAPGPGAGPTAAHEGGEPAWMKAPAWGNVPPQATAPVLERERQDRPWGLAPLRDETPAEEPADESIFAPPPEEEPAEEPEDVVVVPKARGVGAADEEPEAATDTEPELADELASPAEAEPPAPVARRTTRKSAAKKATGQRAGKKTAAKKAAGKKTTAKKAAAKKATRRSAVEAAPIPTGNEAERFDAALTGISGVGPAKRAELLATFGTLRRLRAASPERLAEVPGISATLARRIHDALH